MFDYFRRWWAMPWNPDAGRKGNEVSELSIRAAHGGMSVEVTVTTRGTADDFELVADSAMRAVSAALVRPKSERPDEKNTPPRPDEITTTAEAPYDQAATRRVSEVTY